MSTEQIVYKCAPCGFSATLKTNYERHCLGAKHLVNCAACSKTNTIDFYFKRIEVQVAEVTAAIAEVVASVQSRGGWEGRGPKVPRKGEGNAPGLLLHSKQVLAD